MPTETLVFTVRVDNIRVYFTEIPLLFKATVSVFEIPPGLIRGDYKDLRVEIKRKGGE